MAVYREIYCRSILNKSGIPGIDFALNPYVGCEHKCVYCYAIFMKRFSNHVEDWGDFVDIKVNAPDVLHRQLKLRKSQSHISIGTVCDAYQPIEEKYQLTRKCLEILRYFQHSVSILTKSSLALRDIDILTKMKDIEIGFTVCTLHSGIKQMFEPNSSSVEQRFEALKKLSEKGIKTWVFVAPVLPFISDSDEELISLIKSAQGSGAQVITFDSFNPYPKVWRNVLKIIRANFPDKIRNYHDYYRDKIKYEKALKQRINKISSQFKITVDAVF